MTNASHSMPDNIATMSFEEALRELETLVKTLEDGKATLDNAIGSYERGALLKRHCEAKLRDAQAKIEQIAVNGDGSLSTTPFNT